MRLHENENNEVDELQRLRARRQEQAAAGDLLPAFKN